MDRRALREAARLAARQLARLRRARRAQREAEKAWQDHRRRAEKDLGRALPEAEAARIAVESVHEFRREQVGARGFPRGPISDEEAREWEGRREERRRREGDLPDRPRHGFPGV
jgi:hypothetical protein